MKHIKAAKGIDGNKFPSEFRYDPLTGDWTVIASGRAKRPETFQSNKKKRKKEIDNCPFCNPENLKYKTEVITNNHQVAPDDDLPSDWKVVSIPNKFPAFLPEDDLNQKTKGPYKKMNAVGFHEVIVTRGHKKAMGMMSIECVKAVFQMFRNRFSVLKKKKNVNYISIFHNHGKGAGASINHPHSQLITTPLIDIDLKNNLRIAKEYEEKKSSCLLCDIRDLEKNEGSRVVYENPEFLVFCPYASKTAFQLMIVPKKHMAKFEEIPETHLEFLADSFQQALAKINKGVGDPDYNFYLHTAPCDGRSHDYYHWYWTILPRTSSFAGFEFGAKMEISTVKPEVAAKYLKKI